MLYLKSRHFELSVTSFLDGIDRFIFRLLWFVWRSLLIRWAWSRMKGHRINSNCKEDR